MSMKSYDYFVAEANSGEDRECLVCGSECRASRNVNGPTGFITAMSKRATRHDRFVCPNTDEAWHQKALRLKIAINETPSMRIAKIMKYDLQDLIQENRR
jgi:hypothetical protein